MQSSRWRSLWRTRAEAVSVLVAVSGLVSVSVVTAVLWGVIGDESVNTAGLWVSAVIQVAASLSLLVAYRAPVGGTVVVVTAAAALVLLAWIAPVWLQPLNNATTPWVPFVLSGVAFHLVRHAAHHPRGWVAWTAIGVLVVLTTRPWELNLGLIAGGLLFTAVPALIGMYMALRQRLVQELRDRAERAEREQHLLAERARVEERTRLAADMHDVVTHRVSLMVLQAGALSLTAPDEATRTAAEELRAGGCQALEELRDLVDVLRSTPTGTAPSAWPPATSLAPVAVPDLSELVTESASVGVPVELVVAGDPGTIPPVVGHTAHRVVQEALTNVRKHALGSRVLVRVAYQPDEVRVTVHNTAADPTASCQYSGASLAGSGSGTGLLGLRQRVELVHGRLDTGADPDGGFRVDAILPTTVAPGEAAEHAS